ncbi:MAG TPA: S8 family serine peptidase [Acidimicrobiia bacterium]|nr:S8 family serine peptidase [Acidimicrobiia bacterium]
MAVPATADASGPAPAPELPANAWVVAREADGQLQVVKGDAADQLVADVAAGRPSPEVLSVQTDQKVSALSAGENDPMRSQQWALDQVSFESSWPVTRGGRVVVAVIDSGVLGTHQDLAGSVLPGIDYIRAGSDGRIDPKGHGTHVAGIIAAHVNNGLGIAGAAPSVRILPVRVLDANGDGVASNVAKGIIWAADHGARVINLSLGGGQAPGLEQAIQYANSKRAVVVAAAGNYGDQGNAPTYPAAYPEAIAVAAVDSNLSHPAFSNTGSYVDVAAPGVGIVSAWGTSPTAYASADGTSMATPYASAEAAMIIAAHGSFSAAKVKQVLEGSARDLGPAGVDPWFGHGLINPHAALVASVPRSKDYGRMGHGYWITGSNGRVRAFGNAHFYGDLRGRALSAPIVASARTPNGGGYWLAGADGSVYSFGNARYYGSMGGRPLNSPIVGMAATPTGGGYILLGADGGIFTFGNAHFYGSTGGMHLNARVLDLAMTANGHGYWFVAGDGGVFSFGNAPFHGSTGNIRLAAPVMSMTAASSGRGYWMVAYDGGIFAFNVPFKGSMPAVRALTNSPVVPTVRMRALPSGNGYYLLGVDGSIFSFGSAKNFGSTRGMWAVDLMLAP